ncbi:uncharacterized protein LOC141649335 [Silene latifolia]|uniref:uncharacterized protein LOC141649335 n=1 Tax=Silene latifolia TaxID=37657 RepID=UPI003D7786C5
MECNVLVEKIVSRIKSFGSRKLSYAGRLVMVQAVLLSLHQYWASIFVLPKYVLVKIEGICRNYLWNGTDNYTRTPLVAWDTICQPREVGGLGLRKCELWNNALIGKYVWWMATKSDHLWIKWVDHVYMKGRDWVSYQPSINSSWAWRRICKIKDLFLNAYTDNKWLGSDSAYTPDAGYTWLAGASPKVPWSKLLWHRLIVPKHSFHMWLTIYDRLQTRSRLSRLGICNDVSCCICGIGSETMDHLYWQCPYSASALSLLQTWLRLDIPSTKPWQWCMRMRRRSILQWRLVVASVVGLMYLIWQVRNEARVQGIVKTPEFIVQQLKHSMKCRIRSKAKQPLMPRDMNWLCNRELM